MCAPHRILARSHSSLQGTLVVSLSEIGYRKDCLLSANWLYMRWKTCQSSAFGSNAKQAREWALLASIKKQLILRFLLIFSFSMSSCLTLFRVRRALLMCALLLVAGFLQDVLFQITSMGYLPETLDPMVDGIVEVVLLSSFSVTGLMYSSPKRKLIAFSAFLLSNALQNKNY